MTAKVATVALELFVAAAPAEATQCKGLLSIFEIDTSLSCEQRAAMMGLGAVAPPPAPAFTAPQPPSHTVIVPMDGGAR